MKEKHLKELGFKRIDVSAEESGENAFYYYTYDFNAGWQMSLISNENDVAETKGWDVSIIESGLPPITKKRLVKEYIRLIEKLGG